MGYMALYRKYRPTTFDSMVGQENVTKILKNQIKNGKISHAYLFSGTRGTGKTSAAKVFSRAINCLNPKDGEPCNECDVCKNILEGNTTDVIEMDAASNNSVENIRQIRQEVVYATIDVKYRVYIIDEAHMLTTSAFNALLKTLEEPPANVVFILATTEQHKIPVTILSRCLRFDFNRISEEEMVERLKMVLSEEHMEYEEEAVRYIAKIADGGMRDALSILERCVTESQELLKYEDVLTIVGAIDGKMIVEIADDIYHLSSMSVIEKVEKIIKKGKDLRQVNYQLIEEFLDRLVKNIEQASWYSQIIDRLSRLDNELRLSTKPVIVFKACMIEICSGALSDQRTKSNQSNDSNLVQKMVSLEKDMFSLKQKIDQLELLLASRGNQKELSKKVDGVSNEKENKGKVLPQTTTKEVSLEMENLKPFEGAEAFKKAIIENGHMKLYSALASTKIYTDGTNLIVVTNNSFAYAILAADENKERLKEQYETQFGQTIPIYIRLKESTEESKSKMENVFEQNKINYTNLD